MDVGVVINQYAIVEHIGRGGMADVWSARDQRLNRMVAIKTIAHGLSQDFDPVKQFQDEAQTIAQLDHPHILPIYDIGEFEGQLYIIMRYVTGGSLEDLLRQGALSLNDTLRLGGDVAEALDFAHTNKIVHLDLKPPNILLDSHRAPYLADFGLATALDPEGKAVNPGSGTLLYMAPEQITADVIDHRADIFSFTVVLFHMLTGELPFDAATPLALRQLQFNEELPDVGHFNPSLPSPFNDILRRGSALEPQYRPDTAMGVIKELREALSVADGGDLDLGEAVRGDYIPADMDPYSMLTQRITDENADLGILEAVDIYSRARHNWAGGNGRFLLGVTHFMLMNDYYMEAERHGLELDEAGMQMLLRGALEYDQEVDFWWDKLEDDNRRWVCLHALRSGNAPARVRALRRLETLPDAESPQIPKLVAQALQVETDIEARIAALSVLGTRARLMKQPKQFDIKSEYRGRMLTTMTRLGIQADAPADWQEVVFTPEIDLLIAEIALDDGMPRVADFAARIVGRIRSTAAVRYISTKQQEGRRGALRALALVRDEAPTLPPVVSTQGRFYAWIANTVRRLTDEPLGLVFRHLAAVIGGWLAMGMIVWVTFRSEAIFTPQRWANSIAIGLIFGLFVAAVVVFADEFSSRLRGFWPWWARLVTSVVLGFGLATLTWGQFTWFYLQFSPDWDVMMFGGLGMMFGFVVPGFFRMKSWLAIPWTAAATYIPILLAWRHYWFGSPDLPITEVPLLYFDNPQQIYTLVIPFAILIALGGHFPGFVRDAVGLLRQVRRSQEKPVTPPPLPSVPPAEEMKRVVDPNLLKTEIDVTAGGISEAETLESETEADQEIQSPAEERPDTESRRVNLSTGIRVDQDQSDDEEE